MCFFYVNGCPLELFYDLRDILGDSDFDRSKFDSKYACIDRSSDMRQKYYSYNIANNRMEYLNGQAYII